MTTINKCTTKEGIEPRYNWYSNRDYYEDNYKELKRLYSGEIIIIVNSEVKYATHGFDEWKKAWHSLTPEEQLEAYDVYIPRRNEAIVI